MKTILHKADTRGHFDHGWLRTFHTFSFADYYDPERMRFGALRVLNDDTVAPRQGFGLHPHSNMEIVSIPLSGALTHGDSMGHTQTVRAGEIQVMSAGRGVRHSEMNRSADTPTEFLQIWVLPDRENVEPRYESAVIADLLKPDQISDIVTPYPGTDNGLWIYQQAWFSMGDLTKGVQLEHALHSADSYGVYAFVISGSARIRNTELQMRDGLGIRCTEPSPIVALEDHTRILLIEVPEL